MATKSLFLDSSSNVFIEKPLNCLIAQFLFPCRIGFPMMIVTSLTAAAYLLIVHSGFGWDTEDAIQCVEDGLITV